MVLMEGTQEASPVRDDYIINYDAERLEALKKENATGNSSTCESAGGDEDTGTSEDRGRDAEVLRCDDRIPTAAYCRVSTTSDLQDGSFETQCEYYRKLITDNPSMRLVDIYGDQGKSGRSMYTRPELQRLIADCEAHKVKLILTKSVSRFARNMMECVSMVRHLKELGVTIRFEKERLSTDSMGFELVLGILATLAEEESRSLSQSMNWSRIQHLKQGEPWEAASYGYKSVGERHKWEIVPREAEVIRKAFYMAGMCYKIPEILRELNRMELKNSNTGDNNSTTGNKCNNADSGRTDSGNTSSGDKTCSRNWNRTMLRYALTNLVYKGDYLSNKEVCIVEKDGKAKRVKNKGHVGQILLEGHHEAIVSRELFDVVQKLIKAGLLSARKSIFSDEDVALMKEAMGLAAAENNSLPTEETSPLQAEKINAFPTKELQEQIVKLEQETVEHTSAGKLEQMAAGKLEASPWQM